MKKKKIKGIQLIASEISYPLIGAERSGCYLKGFIEMTIDFGDGDNTIITLKELENFVNIKDKK